MEIIEHDFYPRPHMEGDIVSSYCTRWMGDFYPRPHMEGDGRCILLTCFCRISTHALTWRATHPFQRLDTIRQISTHALTWRAT